MKKVLVIDIGGTNVKFLASGHKTARRFPSGPKLTPRKLVADIKHHAADWDYEAVTIGYPGVVRNGRVLLEPNNLGPGWVGFDFKAAFRRPVKIINDAAMQAIGSYRKGLMLFIGLGTGIGSALVVDGIVVPMELGHLPYREKSYEDYVGLRGFKRLGKKSWRQDVNDVVKQFIAAVHPDDVVLGGGVAKELDKIPKGCRRGHNTYAFLGGMRLWENRARKRKKGM